MSRVRHCYAAVLSPGTGVGERGRKGKVLDDKGGIL